MPRWDGDNKLFEWLECAEWDFCAPGTRRVLLLEFMWYGLLVRLGIDWFKWVLNVCTVSEFEEVCRSFRLPPPAPLPTTPPGTLCRLYEPSSLDIELVLSKSTETVFDSFNSTDPLWLLFSDETNEHEREGEEREINWIFC